MNNTGTGYTMRKGVRHQGGDTVGHSRPGGGQARAMLMDACGAGLTRTEAVCGLERGAGIAHSQGRRGRRAVVGIVRGYQMQHGAGQGCLEPGSPLLMTLVWDSSAHVWVVSGWRDVPCLLQGGCW